MHFMDLTPAIRLRMISEIEGDIRQHTLYPSKRFTRRASSVYPEMLLEAARRFDPAWLAAKLRRNGCFIHTESRDRGGSLFGGTSGQDAAATFAEDQFNRFYIRAVCMHAIEIGHPEVEIYRAKQVVEARTRSERLMGTTLPAAALLDDLRNHPEETEYGVPGGPNSGLSARLSRRFATAS